MDTATTQSATMTGDNSGVMTMTIIPTMKVKRVIMGSRTMNLPEGTTDVDASDVVHPYVRHSSYTYGYAGTKEDATMIIVAVRGYDKDVWNRAAKRLASLLRKHGGAVAR